MGNTIIILHEAVRKRKDKIKKEYAESNYYFLVIPYWDFSCIKQLLLENIKRIAEKEVHEEG